MSIAKHTVEELLTAIAAREPTPGGGAVAALTLALGAALAEMVLNYSRGKKSLEHHARLYGYAESTLREARTAALQLADEDTVAYEAMNAMMRRTDLLPGSAERDTVVAGAISVPLQVLGVAADLARDLDMLAGSTNRHLDSDLAMAAILARAAAASALWNVNVNLPQLSDDAQRRELEQVANDRLRTASHYATQVEEKLRQAAK